MKLTSDQISALRNVSPELADKLEAGESVTVEREAILWSPRESFLYRARHAKETNATLSLLAYREEFAPGYKIPGVGLPAYHPFVERDGKWTKATSRGRSPTTVYMPEEVVDALIDKLDGGEVVL